MRPADCQPLQEPQGSPCLPLTPLHWPLTPPGDKRLILVIPTNLLQPHHALHAGTRTHATHTQRTHTENTHREHTQRTHTENTRREHTQRTHEENTRREHTQRTHAENTHREHTQRTHTENTRREHTQRTHAENTHREHTQRTHAGQYVQELPSPRALWAGPAPGSHTLPWRRPQVPTHLHRVGEHREARQQVFVSSVLSRDQTVCSRPRFSLDVGHCALRGS